MDDGEVRFGSVHAVARRGGTVRRPVGRWTPAVHGLLRHLEHAGFEAAPRVVRVEADVEVLTYIHGDVPVDPWPPALRTDAALMKIGRLLRAFHDAVCTFTPPPRSEWRCGAVPLLTGEVIRHGDVGPWNTVWRGAQVVGLIDWDFAGPGPALADVGQAGIGFIPLARDAVWRRAGFGSPPDRRRRLALLSEAYGADPLAVVDAAQLVRQTEIDQLRELGGQGVEPYATFLARGDDRSMQLSKEWLEDHRDELI